MLTDCMPNLYCINLETSLTFYRDILGLEQTYQYPPTGKPEHVEFKTGNSYLAISSLEAVEKYKLPAVKQDGAFELTFRTDNTDKTFARLKAAGVTILKEPFDNVAGLRAAYVADPDGNRINIHTPIQK